MNLIVAADRYWAIGKDGRALVTIPADQQTLMREITSKVVVVGCKTLESLPGGRPLGNRKNLVLTRDEDYKIKGVHVCHSLEEATEWLQAFDTDDIYIVGGQSIYEQFLPYADTVYVTRTDYIYDAGTFFKSLENDGDWRTTGEGNEQTYFDLCCTFQKF